MKKFLLLFTVLIIGSVSVNAQTYTNTAGPYGYLNYLLTNPTDLSQIYNVRMAQTLSLIENDADSAAARINKGSAVNVTTGYIPVAAGIQFVNSGLYQKSSVVRDTNNLAVYGTTTLTGAVTASSTMKVSGVATFSSPMTSTITALAPFDSTGTISTAKLVRGWITSTSGASTTITLPTATALATALSAGQGTSWTFVVDNSAGSNTVTVALGSGMTANAVITGGNTLTIAAGSIGEFQLLFASGTVARIGRIQ